MKLKLSHALFAELPSTFDVSAFASGSFEGKGDTRRLKLDEGEYPAIVQGPWGDKSKIRNEKGFLILDLTWRPSNPELAQKYGVEQLPTVRQSIFLDLTPAGALDMGQYKNSDLNKLRELFGLNSGARWSFSDFVGKTAKIKVVHKPNEKNPQDPFVNVAAVTAL